MTDLTSLPFPSGSPHFEIYEGQPFFINEKSEGCCSSGLFIDTATTHERTIVCAVAEAFWRRKQEIAWDKETEKDWNESAEFGRAADAWAKAGSETA